MLFEGTYTDGTRNYHVQSRGIILEMTAYLSNPAGLPALLHACENALASLKVFHFPRRTPSVAYWCDIAGCRCCNKLGELGVC